MNRLTRILDCNGNVVDGYIGSGYVDARVLEANSAESHTVPTGAKYVRLSGSKDFYVNFADAAAIPAADITDGSSSILNPTGFYSLYGVTAIGLISSDACVVTMEFFN